MADIWSALEKRVRTAGGAPLVTYIDATTSERTELSATSLANAAAKIANALRDEYDLETGAHIAIDLPLHWQRSAWCAGAWTAGCIVRPGLNEADLVVTSAARAERAAALSTPAVAVSLHPFGLPLAESLPAGIEDATLAVRRQPDAYLHERPQADDVALVLDSHALTQADMMDTASALADRWGLRDGGRLLVTDEEDGIPAIERWIASLAVPIVRDAAVVLVSGIAHPDALSSVRAQEHISAELRLSRATGETSQGGRISGG